MTTERSVRSHRSSVAVLGIVGCSVSLNVSEALWTAPFNEETFYPLTSFHHCQKGQYHPVDVGCYSRIEPCVGPAYLYKKVFKGTISKDFGCDHLAYMFYIIIHLF